LQHRIGLETSFSLTQTNFYLCSVFYLSPRVVVDLLVVVEGVDVEDGEDGV